MWMECAFNAHWVPSADAPLYVHCICKIAKKTIIIWEKIKWDVGLIIDRDVCTVDREIFAVV